MVDIATRVYNHHWKIDPIVRSIIDTDFYKLLMCQSILHHHPKVQVTYSLLNRAAHIPLAQLIDIGELREQLDHIRTLRLSRGESTWMRGNMFYGKRAIFSPAFMTWLENFRFPPYHLQQQGNQYALTFTGAWPEVMLWEIPALVVLMELRSRAVLRELGRFELRVLYARAMTKLWQKIEHLKPMHNIRIADFGTRRRHSFLWQDWCVQAMIEGLNDCFIGTSNCLIALRREVEAIGTNAHELPMVYAALARTDAELARAPYQVCQHWQNEHDGNLRIILPDTFGLKGFLERAPAWLAKWKGVRIDSGCPHQSVQRVLAWWHQHGENPQDKLVIFSDGLDVDDIIDLHTTYSNQVHVSFGWGTLLTNDFRDLIAGDRLSPFSLVCKVVEANGQPTVKFSDTLHKTMGQNKEIERYRRIFGAGAKIATPPLRV